LQSGGYRFCFPGHIQPVEEQFVFYTREPALAKEILKPLSATA
jgi:hypothetical protein